MLLAKFTQSSLGALTMSARHFVLWSCSKPTSIHKWASGTIRCARVSYFRRFHDTADWWLANHRSFISIVAEFAPPAVVRDVSWCCLHTREHRQVFNTNITSHQLVLLLFRVRSCLFCGLEMCKCGLPSAFDKTVCPWCWKVCKF